MSVKILINAVDPEECRIAKVKNNRLEEFHIESAAREITHGNIYKGIIARIEPSLQAVFIDYGAERHGFLPRHDIHPDYFQDTRSGSRSLPNILKRGQEILVQVVKDPLLKKGALLTTYISLPGRHTVLMPGSTTLGVSRKIEDEDERTRLKKIVSQLKCPEGFGFIVRTAGAKCSKTRIAKDIRYLLRLWKNINKKGIKENPPALLYKEQNLVLRSLRDYFTLDVTSILVDDETVFKEVKDFVRLISPKHTQLTHLYQGDKPIFSKHQLEHQIASIYETRVSLKSGGSIVIESTEALVAIDVNSGKSTQEKSFAQTAFMTNLESAEEVARQLRLRDLGGLIIVDFIDMKDPNHRIEILKAMKNHVKEDKARTRVGKISRFGLMEMSRQRIRPSIEFGSFQSCPQCQGKGQILSTESLALGFLRKLRLETLKANINTVKGIVPPKIADYLLNKKRREILDLELRRDLSITIDSENTLIPGESKIACE